MFVNFLFVSRTLIPKLYLLFNRLFIFIIFIFISIAFFYEYTMNFKYLLKKSYRKNDFAEVSKN